MMLDKATKADLERSQRRVSRERKILIFIVVFSLAARIHLFQGE